MKEKIDELYFMKNGAKLARWGEKEKGTVV